MRRRRLASTIGIAALAGCASRPAPSADVEPCGIPLEATLAPPDADVPVAGERLDYDVRLAGLPVGNATLETSRELDAWRFEATAATNALLDWIYPVRGAASTRTADDGSPRSFYLCVDEDGEVSERSLHYGASPCLWYRPDGQPGWACNLAQCDEPRDPLSLLQALRGFDPGLPLRDVEVAMTLRSHCYRVRFLGREDLEVDAGAFAAALLWRIEVHAYESMEAPARLGPLLGYYAVAISADERRLPLRIEREFGFGQVSLELRDASIAEPATPVAALSAAIGR